MWCNPNKVTYLKDYYICNNKLMIYISKRGAEPIGKLLDYIQRFETRFDKIVLYDPDFISDKFKFIFEKPVDIKRGVYL